MSQGSFTSFLFIYIRTRHSATLNRHRLSPFLSSNIEQFSEGCIDHNFQFFVKILISSDFAFNYAIAPNLTLHYVVNQAKEGRMHSCRKNAYVTNDQKRNMT
jgi:hypothetical protein